MLINFIFIIFENKNSGVSSLVEIYFFAFKEALHFFGITFFLSFITVFREKNNDESDGKLANGFPVFPVFDRIFNRVYGIWISFSII